MCKPRKKTWQSSCLQMPTSHIHKEIWEGAVRKELPYEGEPLDTPDTL